MPVKEVSEKRNGVNSDFFITFLYCLILGLNSPLPACRQAGGQEPIKNRQSGG